MLNTPSVPDYFFDITLPGFPGSKEVQRKNKEERKNILDKIISSRKMHLGAKRICLKCFTPIYDEGECPNCE